MTKFTYNKKRTAWLTEEGCPDQLMAIPDQIANDQRHHARLLSTFPAMYWCPFGTRETLLVQLDPEAYGLFTDIPGAIHVVLAE